jgi:hypothetical protein
VWLPRALWAPVTLRRCTARRTPGALGRCRPGAACCILAQANLHTVEFPGGAIRGQIMAGEQPLRRPSPSPSCASSSQPPASKAAPPAQPVRPAPSFCSAGPWPGCLLLTPPSFPPTPPVCPPPAPPVPDLTYTANLNGENQVPEPVDTTATASFKLMQDGEEYMYELTVLGAYRCADRLYRRHRCERHMLARPAWPRLPAAAWGPSQPALPPGASGWSEGCPAPTVAPAPAAAQALRA